MSDMRQMRTRPFDSRWIPQKKRHHAQYSPLRRRQFDCWRRPGATTDALRGCFIVSRAICAVARRDEDREQPPDESSLTCHGKIQLALGFSFEERAGDVRSAASVKVQQNVIVAVENRDRPRRCHQGCSIPKTSKMRPLAVAGSALSCVNGEPLHLGIGGAQVVSTANYFHSAYATSNAAQSGLCLDQSVLGPLSGHLWRQIRRRTDKITNLDGDPSRPIVVIAFDSVEKAQA